MILSRTPLRLSFCGGGSDLPAFYREHGGAVLSMAITKYVYLSMHDYFEERGSVLKYSEIERPASTAEIKHRIIRQVFSEQGIERVDLSSSADVPAGTGMGSSSAFTVGLLNLCHAFRGTYVGRRELAAQACRIEIEELGEPIGKQDQYSCALGGLNFIEFNSDESVSTEVVPLSQGDRQLLESSLLLFYLGGTRSASTLLRRQGLVMQHDPRAVTTMKRMVDQARSLRADLPQDVSVLGPYLDEAWQLKRSLSSGISSADIDGAYERVRRAGATGGKLLGAGGAGFLLVHAAPDRQDAVRAAMTGLRCLPVMMDSVGSAVIYSD